MDFLLEVGCEEIPARFVTPALDEITRLFGQGLGEARLEAPAAKVRTFGTPRRLALLASGLPQRQADLDEELLGPRVEAAFGPDGQPTKACLGFARGKGVEVSELQRIDTPKGEVVGLRRQTAGRPTGEVIGALVGQLLGRLSFPKTMRWGLGEHLFARPVHWLVCLLDDQVVELEFAGVRAGRSSRGHRFAAPGAFDLPRPEAYVAMLRERQVLVDPAERRALVASGARALAAEVGGRLLEDPGLEEEVAQLTESPVPLLGRFDRRFLELPRQVLVAAMRNHQRYFSIENGDGQLLDAFVAVGNTPIGDPATVRYGNERVLTARLSDARFFYRSDQEMAPADRVPGLQDMLFQADLGTYYDKAIRVAGLAVTIAHLSGLGSLTKLPRVIEALSVRIEGLAEPGERFSWLVARAALLAKTDLLTEMVGEFPELQGEMGADYARLADEDALVVRAVGEHYRPRHSGDAPPATDAGAILAIADRLDSLVGCFGIGLRPTGTADPFALRRACLGVISIVTERGLRLSLRELLDAAVSEVRDKVKASRLRQAQERSRKTAARKKIQPVLPTSVEPFDDELVADVLGFFEGRLRTRLGEIAPSDVVEAVLGAGFDDLVELRLRVEALADFSRQPAYQDLAVAFKRVANIIRGFECGELDPDLFAADAERELYDVYCSVTPRFEALVEKDDYRVALGLLATELRGPVDRFFDAVLVNDPDDPARQANRKALLSGIGMLFGRIADFSRLQTRD